MSFAPSNIKNQGFSTKVLPTFRPDKIVNIEKDDFINENFVPKDTFVFVGYRDNLDLADAVVVDSGMYACVYLDSFDDEIDFAKKLLEHCKEQNWTVCGDYFCEIMTEFNVFDDSRRSMFLRLQVPVNFAR